MKKLFLAATAAAVLASAGSAYALEDNQASLNVSADVREGCTLSFGITDMSFGTLTKSSGDMNIQDNTFIVSCNGQPVHVDLNMGKNAGGGTERYMALAGADGAIHKLHYAVYQGKNGSAVWGSGKDTYNVPGANTNIPGIPMPFYAVVTPADIRNADVISGHYTDTLVATVYYGSSTPQ